MQSLDATLAAATSAIADAASIDALEALRVSYLGKKGQLTELLKGVALLSPADRPRMGQAVNQAKQTISTLIEQKNQVLLAAALQHKLEHERCDVTLPGKMIGRGSLHPVLQMQASIVRFFSQLGFDVVQGPEIETEYYNFEALNIPASHPARTMHDTFYFHGGDLLRTHTSNVQARWMHQHQPPFRLIAPGRVYRHESDLTHTPMFHQVEGLFVDQHVTFSHLRYTLQTFLTQLFHTNISVRFRPSYFPFTEPSAEVDMTCMRCEGAGCRLCKFEGWIEVGGCGMVHPAVLKAAKVDCTRYQGWAFGMGIDRLALLYHGIDDLRVLFENDIEFLKQF